MSAINALKAVLLSPDGFVSIRGSMADCKIIQESLVEIEKQLNLFVYDKLQRMKPQSIEDIIYDFTEALDFDAVLRWARILGIEINYPPLKDMWPDWQGELTVEVGDAMLEVSSQPVPLE